MRLQSPSRPGRLAFLHAAALAIAGLAAPQAFADSAPEEEKKPEFTWQAGPGKMLMADEAAALELTEAELFLDGAQTIKLLEKMGNTTSGDEVGLIRPSSEEEGWFLVFEYEKAGYVKDDEAGKIDADALLESIKEGTEASNEYRKERGIPGLHVDRWSDPPHYDPKTHNLVWGILAHDDNGEQVINYNVRILGREGFMSVTLVDDPKMIEASKASFQKMMARFSYQPGKTYAEWKEGDKVAEYGLTALVAAGAGAAAVKMGLFSKLFAFIGKFAKVLIIGVAAGAAALVRLLKGVFGGGSSNRQGP